MRKGGGPRQTKSCGSRGRGTSPSPKSPPPCTCGMGKRTPRSLRPDLQEFFRQYLGAAYAQGGRASADEIVRFSRPWHIPLPQITTPVHLWHGEADTALPPSRLARILPPVSGSRLCARGAGLGRRNRAVLAAVAHPPPPNHHPRAPVAWGSGHRAPSVPTCKNSSASIWEPPMRKGGGPRQTKSCGSRGRGTSPSPKSPPPCTCGMGKRTPRSLRPLAGILPRDCPTALRSSFQTPGISGS